MGQKTLSNWLKLIVGGLAIGGLIVYFVAVPKIGRDIAIENPEFAYCFLPWIIFLWITALPYYYGLLYGWSIACEIGCDRSFTQKNANSLKKIMGAAILDTSIFFIGNVIFLCLDMNHISIILVSLLVCFIGTAIAVIAGALSHIVAKAAARKKEEEEEKEPEKERQKEVVKL